MSDSCVRIERFSNGFTVEIKDPALVKYNALPYDKEKNRPYKEPWKTFVFKTSDEVLAFLKKNLKKAIVNTNDDDDDEYGTAFSTAVSDNDGDE